MIGVAVLAIAVVVVSIYIFVELKRMRHKVFAFILIGIILFIFLTSAFVFKGKGIDYKTLSGIFDASKIYLSWLGGVFSNLGTITTNAIKMDWSNNTIG